MRRIQLRDRIMEAALHLFDHKGYHGVTIDDIVREAGTSKGGFYYHFSSKEALLFVIHDVFITYALDKATLADESHEDPVKKLSAIIREFLKVFHLYKPHITVFYQESNYLRAKDRQIIHQKRKAFKQIMISVIDEGKLQHKFRPEINTDITVMAILGMVNWLYKWYQQEGVCTIEQIGNHYVDLILHSLLTMEFLAAQTNPVKMEAWSEETD